MIKSYNNLWNKSKKNDKKFKFSMNKNKKKIIVTGSAGFIGYSLCMKLLERGDELLGIDNHNDYYDPNLQKSLELKNY